MAKKPFRSGSEGTYGAAIQGLIQGITTRKQLEEMAAERAIKQQMVKMQEDEARRSAIKSRFDIDRSILDLERGTSIVGSNGETQSVPGVRGISVDPNTGSILRGSGFDAGAKTVRSAPSGAATKAPAGYRYKVDGSLEPIPGGPAENKMETARRSLQSKLDNMGQRANRVSELVDQVSPRVGNLTAGFIGSKLAKIEGTSALDVSKAIDTIKANIGFDELNTMRRESPTGGALGQVSERELTYLQSVLANLEQSQSPKQLRENLLKVKTEVQNSRQRIQEAFEKDFGPNQGTQNQPIQFGSVQEADAANLPNGTIVFIQGRKAVIE